MGKWQMGELQNQVAKARDRCYKNKKFSQISFY